MDIPSHDHVTCRTDVKNDHRRAGFSLLEMMMVIAVILIIAAISTPFYKTVIIRSREALLREQLFTLRNLINEQAKSQSLGLPREAYRKPGGRL